MIAIPVEFQIAIVLLLVFIVFIAFVKELMAPDVVAMSAVAILLALGILTTDEVLGVFSNNATMIIACMFIISAALERTGIVEAIGRFMMLLSDKNPALAIISIMGTVIILSIFVNNTSVVVIMTPVMVAVANKMGKSPSKFLIPLSYCSIFAGTTTLIGTSTNILVDGVARKNGLEPFGIFEITLPAMVLGAVGILYLALIGRKMLPDRKYGHDDLVDSGERKFITEILITNNSPLIGKTLEDSKLWKNEELKILDLKRRYKSFTKNIGAMTITGGDRLSILTNQREISAIKELNDLKFKYENQTVFEEITTEEEMVMEAIVGPHSKFIGKQVSKLNLGVNILAVHRPKGAIKKDISDIKISYGDTLIVEGAATKIKNLLENNQLLNVSQPQEKPFRKKKAPIALLAIAGVIGIAAFNIIPIAGLAIIAATIVIATRCIDVQEAYGSIQWSLLMLIFSMLAISIAMEKTGAINLIADSIIGLFSNASPIIILSAIYLLTSIMTEIFSNNASAVLMTSIAIGLAQKMGVDPRPFAVAVMFGASASFATPIGYQTNTFVYNAGGYKFLDFVKIGLPLNIILWIVATFTIPIFWPL